MRLFFIIVLNFIILNQLQARRWYVNTNKLTGIFDGGSWETAFNNLGQCIPNTNVGDEIWITKSPDHPYGAGRDKTIEIPSGVKLYGGFSGFETSISQRNLNSGYTKLTGNVGDEGTSNDNSYHVVTMNNTNNQTRLDGFEIVAGNANGIASSNFDKGAGLFISGGSPVIANCKISSNYADYGAGITIINNANVTIDSVIITGNTSSYGGGIFFNTAFLNVKKTSILSNNSSNSGSALYTNSSTGTVYLDRCNISSNYSNGPTIDFENANIRIELYNSLIVGNYTNANIISNTKNNTFKSVNCTYSGNASNSSNSYVIQIDNTTNKQSKLYNSIIWSNIVSQSFSVINQDTTIIAQNSIIEGGYASGLNIYNANPDFINPGVPQSAPFLPSEYNYRLNNNSIAIDTGNNSLLSPIYTQDLDNVKRTIGRNVDLGAYEYINFKVTVSADTTVCSGRPVTLIASGATTYTWNNGATTASITVTPTTSTYYIVTGTKDGVSLKDTVNVFVWLPRSTYRTQTICQGQTYSFNGMNLSTSGTYRDTLQQVNGCDSFIVLTLTVNPSKTTNITQTIQSGQTYPFNGMNLTTSGTYRDTLLQTNGCDSFIVLTLTVITGIKNTISFLDHIAVFPNPAEDFISIELSSKKPADFQLEILGIDGKVYWQRAYYSTRIIQDKINLSELAKGMYFMKIRADDEQVTYKIIKK